MNIKAGLRKYRPGKSVRLIRKISPLDVCSTKMAARQKQHVNRLPAVSMKTKTNKKRNGKTHKKLSFYISYTLNNQSIISTKLKKWCFKNFECIFLHLCCAKQIARRALFIFEVYISPLVLADNIDLGHIENSLYYLVSSNNCVLYLSWIIRYFALICF